MNAVNVKVTTRSSVTKDEKVSEVPYTSEIKYPASGKVERFKFS